jgi:hypothetical protein
MGLPGRLPSHRADASSAPGHAIVQRHAHRYLLKRIEHDARSRRHGDFQLCRTGDERSQSTIRDSSYAHHSAQPPAADRRRRSQCDRSSWPPSSLLRTRCAGPTPSPAAYWCCWRWPAWPPCAEPPADRGVRAPASPLPGARTQIPWRPAAGWEHMMSLNYRQRYQLRLVKAGVRRSDPLLSAVFGMFGRLCPGALCYDGGEWRG